jgi:peptide chain release factor 3
MDIESPRCTFAIISHPDAGKTTMTEKLLWFGRVVRVAGVVKSKKGQFAKSDWMEMEKERGISITSSVMSFPYDGRAMHLLDTPGHKDFSEDTYRTLTAVESVLTMIDSAKGVEEQTEKLMRVCRKRDTPIVTFMNKFDRDTRDPFELIENVEDICSIQCVPMTWPIGDGVNFKGVYDLKSKLIRTFSEGQDPLNPRLIDASDLDGVELKKFIGETLLAKLKEDLEMINELMPEFDKEEFLAGIQTPVFFGSALNNFGVQEVLDCICKYAPTPLEKEVKLPPFDETAPTKLISPKDKTFSGFIFKIQANMDKRHRDRVAFLRVCSGKFERNQKIFHVRSGKEIKVASPLIFQAQDREVTDFAFPGDIIGLHDTGKFQIGDTFTDGELIQFTGIPSFAPEIFMKVILKDPLKSKQLEKGLKQLSEEGTVQLFSRYNSSEKFLGAVGLLQFEVVKHRLETEYHVRGEFEPFSLEGIRWLKFKNEKTQDEFIGKHSASICYDAKDRVCFAVKSNWDLKMRIENNPDVKFYSDSDYKSLSE